MVASLPDVAGRVLHYNGLGKLAGGEASFLERARFAGHAVQFQPDLAQTIVADAELLGSRGRQIDDTPGAERPSVIDANDHRAFCVE